MNVRDIRSVIRHYCTEKYRPEVNYVGDLSSYMRNLTHRDDGILVLLDLLLLLLLLLRQSPYHFILVLKISLACDATYLPFLHTVHARIASHRISIFRDPA